MRTCSPRLVGLVSMQRHNLYFQARLLKQGFVSAFTTGRGNGSRTNEHPLPFVQSCPRKAEEQSIITTPRVSSQLRAAPAPSAWWPGMLAGSAEGWDLCPCLHFSRHRVDLSNETLQCFMCHLPHAAPCQPTEFMAALPLGDKRSHKSPNSFAGSRQHII